MYRKKKKIPQHKDQLHVHRVDDMLLDKNCLNTTTKNKKTHHNLVNYKK